MASPSIARMGLALVTATIFPDRRSYIWGSTARTKRTNGQTSSSR
jgi:hypothetical protein